jgi:hypothetical protein
VCKIPKNDVVTGVSKLRYFIISKEVTHFHFKDYFD